MHMLFYMACDLRGGGGGGRGKRTINQSQDIISKVILT